MRGGRGITIIHDGACPLCASCVRMTRLRAEAGAVRLIDARSGLPETRRIAVEGVSLDDGMVVLLDGVALHGEAAMRHLAVLTAPGGVFGAKMRRIFRSPRRAAAIHPWLVRGRRLLLRLLGRRPIADRATARGRRE